jgi:lipoprotein-anchoring transpeptidase ErfK/SrfK
MRRSRRRLEPLLAVALILIAAVVFAVAVPSPKSGDSGAKAQPNAVKPLAEISASRGYQELAALISAHQVFRAPGARAFQRISATRPITGEQTVLPVLQQVSRRGTEWLHVRLPGRPNGLTGWIAASATKLEYTRWRIVVNRAKRDVYVYRAGRLVRSFRAVVGAPATPTPKGSFFVEENVALKPSAVGYPYALALSARSNVFQEFDGGPGQIALHGLDNVGGTPGTAISHGCVRLDTSDISWLAHHVDTGVPVTIL